MHCGRCGAGRRARSACPARLGRDAAGAATAIFLRYHDLILDHQEQLLDLVQIESGKARRHAVEEIYDVAINARSLCVSRGRLAAHAPSPDPAADPDSGVGISPPHRAGRHHRAVELPADHGDVDAIPALLAGNVVLLKPAGLTPFAALYAVQLLREAGLRMISSTC